MSEHNDLMALIKITGIPILIILVLMSIHLAINWRAMLLMCDCDHDGAIRRQRKLEKRLREKRPVLDDERKIEHGSDSALNEDYEEMKDDDDAIMVTN